MTRYLYHVIGALVLLAYLASCAPGWAHSWYEIGCCSGQDCEPLPEGAVTEVKGGYHVKYIGKQGFAVDAFVPYEKARQSQDGQFHGCASKVRFLCLYVPMSV